MQCIMDERKQPDDWIKVLACRPAATLGSTDSNASAGRLAAVGRQQWRQKRRQGAALLRCSWTFYSALLQSVSILSTSKTGRARCKALSCPGKPASVLRAPPG